MCVFDTFLNLLKLVKGSVHKLPPDSLSLALRIHDDVYGKLTIRIIKRRPCSANKITISILRQESEFFVTQDVDIIQLGKQIRILGILGGSLRLFVVKCFNGCCCLRSCLFRPRTNRLNILFRCCQQPLLDGVINLRHHLALAVTLAELDISDLRHPPDLFTGELGNVSIFVGDPEVTHTLRRQDLCRIGRDHWQDEAQPSFTVCPKLLICQRWSRGCFTMQHDFVRIDKDVLGHALAPNRDLVECFRQLRFFVCNPCSITPLGIQLRPEEEGVLQSSFLLQPLTHNTGTLRSGNVRCLGFCLLVFCEGYFQICLTQRSCSLSLLACLLRNRYLDAASRDQLRQLDGIHPDGLALIEQVHIHSHAHQLEVVVAALCQAEHPLERPLLGFTPCQWRQCLTLTLTSGLLVSCAFKLWARNTTRLALRDRSHR